jgi:GntR family transcriptional regulator
MISVITTKRAYDELEKEGFVVSIQGKGSYVSPQSSEMLREEHLRQIEEHLKAALALAAMSGISLEEVIETLHILEEEVG